MKGKILIIYYHYREYPLRTTIQNFFNCFKKYSNSLCYYVNALFNIPSYLKNVNFDLIIYHDSFLYTRSRPKRFLHYKNSCKILKNLKAHKAAIVQDEHFQTKLLNQFINEFNINHIFSCAAPSEWKRIYPDINYEKVKIEDVLTGYLDEDIVKKIDKLTKNQDKRLIDIGYRASPMVYHLGSHGYLKYKIAEVFKSSAPRFNLKIDISNNPKDTFLGLDWYRFLLNCKYVIGVESGSSILDPEGKIERCVTEFIAQNPNADFQKAENTCFKGLDGELNYFALGPRHLESCVTKTCQILIEGNYNGILKANKHYIELKKDFSNLNEVLEMVKKNEVRGKIVEQAYRDIVESNKYTYRNFVKQILTSTLGENYNWSDINKTEKFLYKKNQKREKLIWKLIPAISWISNTILNNISKGWFLKIVKFFDQSKI